MVRRSPEKVTPKITSDTGALGYLFIVCERDEDRAMVGG